MELCEPRRSSTPNIGHCYLTARLPARRGYSCYASPNDIHISEKLRNCFGSRTKNGPSAKASGRGTGSHVESGRGIVVICTRGWSPVSSARVHVLASNGSGDGATRVLARSAISDERAYALRP